MAYRALYREYRPKCFADVIGQSHITRILQNQIATNHIAHAYLFCGSRGTGKTSTAKIFARAMNCEKPVNGEPCGECESCRRSSKDTCPDIQEIDAASNNGVDSVRSLIEKAQFTPLELKKRVFIIDEAHMITSQAFNALLKTLEEPPAHIVFILATTEPQKIPATIISRCQRFDFHRLTVDDITLNLKNVLAKTGASADAEALSVIAHAAEGAMRDALSLADQCLSFGGNNITGKDVNDILGSMEQDFLFQAADRLIALDASGALQMLDQVVRSGKTLPVFCQDLSSHFRSLLLARTCGRCEQILECTEELMDRYMEQAEKASGTWILSSLEKLLQIRNDMRYLSSPRTLLEAAFVRICHPELDVSVDGLTVRIELLEKQLTKLALAPAPGIAVPSALTAQPQQKSLTDKPIVETVPVPESEINVTAEPEPAPESLNPGDDVEALWNALLFTVERLSPFERPFLDDVLPQKLDGDTLTVGLDKSKEAMFKTLTSGFHLQKLNAAMEQVRPGTKLSVVLIDRKPVSQETENRLRKEFGDKLIIKD